MKFTAHLAVALALLPIAEGCRRSPPEERAPTAAQPAPDSETAAEKPSDPLTEARYRMVRDQIASRGVSDRGVLAAMRAVPRHEFVPQRFRSEAYRDSPLPIGHDQTISQPYIVAIMTELADVEPGSRVLEVGTGSGYQAAVLAAIGAEVYSIEIVRPLGERAAKDLARLGYKVETRIGDGYRGWPEAAPFDAIIVTAAPPEVPKPLKDQLKVGGNLVIPVGDSVQELRVITRTDEGFRERAVLPVMFVPMTGEAQN